MPNMSDVWDWNFFWNVVSNWLSSAAPFALIVVAAIVVGLILQAVVGGVDHNDPS